MATLTNYQRYKPTYQAYALVHPEHPREAARLYRQRHKDKCNEKNRIWRKKYPMKKSAGNLITQHAYKFPLGSECEFCGTKDKLVRHHPDYTFQNIIVTCCASCHLYLHFRRDRKK